MKNVKIHGIRFAVYFFISIIFCYWYDGTEGIEILKLALITVAILYVMWILETLLRKRIGNHIFWIVPAATAIIYFVGYKKADSMPGLNGLGLFLFVLYIAMVLVIGYLLFCAELLYRKLKRK
ncbi:MAG: hypothetical protein IKZ39_04310 [Lachnospiraceae bacterium]|nr:hypothetical protein [Lachnospiraceae bacterium]